MAERKSTAATYDSVMRDLKARKFSPIYILMGEESYYIDKISDYIAEHVLPPEERDFNQSILFGADVSSSQLVDLAKGYPMMAQYRVIIVKESQNLKATEPLEKYLDNPVPSTILVLCHKNGSIDKRKKLVPKAASVGVVFESNKMREADLPRFVEDYLKQHGASIDQKAAFMVADHIGTDLSRLISELDKVLISLPADKRVTPDIVEKQIGVSKEFNPFELRNAIVNRNIYKANQIIKYFDKNPKAGSLYAFLPLLFNYFQNLMIAYYAPQKTSRDSVAQFLDLRSGWAATDYMTGMRNYSGMKTMQIINKFREIDAKSKGLDNPNTPPGDLMKELIFFILH
ncbi:DNA polymerase III subunit delta [Prevotella sp. KH2C16]|uniref:DNA polymerase III subunit delta n=1 Tax=Prevotella sp. KH2C16 TaxID=1855325 RepID=UPI0008E6F77F|nr:DNA polymerase III subunit delta [Prevotella sp. KH2C16]SFG60653.1 DNA polymerase III, delta subunit [Prevotella sp. KH2C16]